MKDDFDPETGEVYDTPPAEDAPDDTAAHETAAAAMERMEDAAAAHDFAPDSLRGDVRDAILDAFRAQPKPWEKMTEAEQKAFNAVIGNIASDVVRGAIDVALESDWPHVTVTVDRVTVIPGEHPRAEAKVVAGRHQFGALGDLSGCEAILVSTDAREFYGQRQAARVDPDQPGLPVGEEDETSPPEDAPEGQETKEEGEEVEESAEPEPETSPPPDDDLSALMGTLRVLIGLPQGKGSAVDPSVAADLLERGYIAESKAKTASGPPQYRITAAGRQVYHAELGH